MSDFDPQHVGEGLGGGVVLVGLKALWDKFVESKREEHVAKALDDVKAGVAELKTSLAVLVERDGGRWATLEAEVRALREELLREREAKHDLASKMQAFQLGLETRLARLEGKEP